MNKEELLRTIKEAVISGQLSKYELLEAFGDAPEEKESSAMLHNIGITGVLYTVGALVIVVGAIALVVQNWISLGEVGRIGVTFGLAIAFYISATVLFFREWDSRLVQALYGVSLTLLPIGLIVSLFEITSVLNDRNVILMIAIISGVSATVALASITLRKSFVIFPFFGIAYGTWFLYMCLTYAIWGASGETAFNFYAYLSIAIGVAYYFLAKMFLGIKIKEFLRLSSLFYGLSAVFALGPILALGGIWDILLAPAVISVMVLSVYEHSRLMLFIGAAFLIFNIIEITSKYFAGSIGWPIALIFIGIATLAIGYGTFWVNTNYLSAKQ